MRSNIFQESFSDLIRLIYPKLCAGCGDDLPGERQLICLRCLSDLPFTHFYQHDENPVEKIFRGRLPLVHASAHLFFTKDSILQNLLHHFKYRGQTAIGTYLGRSMGESFSSCPRYDGVDALIPLPLFYSRERKRGYNQAEILCNGISETWNRPVLTQNVGRLSLTGTQTRRNRNQRWENIEGKFGILSTAGLEGRHVMLVDDVITTGATLESCGTELLRVPGLQLSVAALAFTLR